MDHEKMSAIEENAQLREQLEAQARMMARMQEQMERMEARASGKLLRREFFKNVPKIPLICTQESDLDLSSDTQDMDVPGYKAYLEVIRLIRQIKIDDPDYVAGFMRHADDPVFSADLALRYITIEIAKLDRQVLSLGVASVPSSMMEMRYSPDMSFLDEGDLILFFQKVFKEKGETLLCLLHLTKEQLIMLCIKNCKAMVVADTQKQAGGGGGPRARSASASGYDSEGSVELEAGPTKSYECDRDSTASRPSSRCSENSVLSLEDPPDVLICNFGDVCREMHRRGIRRPNAKHCFNCKTPTGRNKSFRMEHRYLEHMRTFHQCPMKAVFVSPPSADAYGADEEVDLS